MTRGIEELTVALQRAYPGITIEQLRAQPEAENDDVWFVRHPLALVAVQVQSPNGDAPFSIESDLAPPTVAPTVAAATRLVIARLGLLSTTS
ncbi:MAG TPA: hypothetical protein VG868_00950 [Casimicrobiaceae bacterium]|nr:hypothetical protein [Casimicrobiaceae bacterium]